MIRTDDMLNGSGLRVVVFVSGCDNCCYNCHNPETWDLNSGNKFDTNTLQKVIKELNKDYISGLTLSGGDPLKTENLEDIYSLVKEIKSKFPNKTVWLYTGYEFEKILNNPLRTKIVELCDVVVDGKYIEDLADVNYPWAGSTNQRVIDVKKSLEQNSIVLYE